MLGIRIKALCVQGQGLPLSHINPVQGGTPFVCCLLSETELVYPGLTSKLLCSQNDIEPLLLPLPLL